MDILNSLDKFKQVRVAVIGEGILDEYLKGSAPYICREAPVPVINYESSRAAPGGAANTARNAAGLGAEVIFFSVLGKDSAGKRLRMILEEHGVRTNVIFDPKRSTLHKQRVISGNQMLIRIDKGTTAAIDSNSQKEMISELEDTANNLDAVILSDYSGGVITDAFINETGRIIRNRSMILAVDAKTLKRYPDIKPTFIKPNYSEAVSFAELEIKSGKTRIKQIAESRETILRKSKAEIAAVTLDKDGALILEKNRKPCRTYAKILENPNEAGAGDVFTGAFVLSLASGFNAAKAGEIASAASSVAAGKKEGTASCSLDELKGYFSHEDKHTGLDELKKLIQYYRSQGAKIVFTNGCFDILHRGHIHFLSQCKGFGNILIVGVNSDESIKRIKGKTRPINRLNDRIKILSSLSCIDHVIEFNDDAPYDIIKILKPDIFVKGSNHRINNLPEVPLIKKLGGKVKILPYLKEYSTREILEKASKSADY